MLFPSLTCLSPYAIIQPMNAGKVVSLMAEVNVLSRIREDLEGLVGKPIRLRANRGRKRVLEVDGILEQTYPNVFVVRWTDRQAERRISYNYADLLTKEVELSAEEAGADSASAVS